MSGARVVAVVDGTDATEAVLAAAAVTADLFGVPVEVVHVAAPPSGDLKNQDGQPTPREQAARAFAERAGARFVLRHGRAEEELPAAACEEGVAGLVLGSRRGPGVSGGGPVARAVVRKAAVPVVVVPAPEAGGAEGRATPRAPRALRRALVPLDGMAATALALRPVLARLAAAGVEVVAVHVFDTARGTGIPKFWEAGPHHEESWAAEFVARQDLALPEGTTLHVRAGDVATHVVELAEATGADLVVLAWSQDLRPGRAPVVQALRSNAKVPVLVVPVGPKPARAPGSPAGGSRLA